MSEILLIYSQRTDEFDKFYTYLGDNLGYYRIINSVQKLTIGEKDAMQKVKSVIIFLGEQSSQEAWLSEPNNPNRVILENAIAQDKQIIVVLSSDSNPFQAEHLPESLSSLASNLRYKLHPDSFYSISGKLIKELRVANPSVSTSNQQKSSYYLQKEIEYNELAPIYMRAIAYLIDMFIFSITRRILEYELVTRQINTPQRYAITTASHLESMRQVYVLFAIVSLVIFLGYFVIPLALSGQTLGKFIMQIKVVHVDGTDINFIQALVRPLGYIPSILLLFGGFLWAFVDFDRRTLHDILAGTTVVRK